MIPVTLNFINVDAAIRGLREIPRNLLVGEAIDTEDELRVGEAISIEDKLPGEVKSAPVVEKPAAKKEEPKAAKQEPAGTQPTAETTAAPEPKVEQSAPSVDYPTLQKAVFALAGKSREAAGSVAQSFGVKTFKELDQSKWADALVAVNDKIAELEAA